LPGGITNGFGIPVDVFVKLEITIYPVLLFRNTQNVPFAGVADGRTSVFSVEFVML
jgi:hypothetical protein